MYIVSRTEDNRLQFYGEDFEFTCTHAETEIIENCLASLADLSSHLNPLEQHNFIHSLFKDVMLNTLQSRLLELQAHNAYQILTTLPDELLAQNDQVWGAQQ